MIYGMLITATGWTWEYIDENMDFFRLHELMEYWKEFPLPHVNLQRLVHLVAGLGGVKLPDGPQQGIDASLVDPHMLMGAGVKVDV